MKCAICRVGETATGTTTVTLEKNEMTFVIKKVPAEICRNCGEYYLDETTAGRVTALATQAAAKGQEVQILKYVA